MKYFIKHFCVIITLLTVVAVNAHAQSFINVKGRLAYSSDGNNFDRDDIGASAMALFLFDASGQKHKLVHFHYADYVWSNGPRNMYQETVKTAQEGRQRFGFPSSIFYDAYANENGTIANLTKEINKSTSANPLTIIAAGPMHIICEAVKRSNNEPRKHVSVVVHSLPNKETYNDRTSVNGSCNMAKFRQIRPSVRVDGVRHGGIEFNHTNYNQFNWMANSSNPDIRWVYSRMKVALPDRANVSDVNLVLAPLTGQDTLNPAKLRVLMEKGGNGNNNGGNDDGGSVTPPANPNCAAWGSTRAAAIRNFGSKCGGSTDYTCSTTPKGKFKCSSAAGGNNGTTTNPRNASCDAWGTTRAAAIRNLGRKCDGSNNYTCSRTPKGKFKCSTN